MSWARRFRQITVWTVLVAIIAAILAALFYHLFFLNAQGRTYISNFRPAASSLSVKCAELTKQTEKLIIDSPPQSETEANTTIKSLQEISKQTRNELAHFDSVSDDFLQMPNLPIARDYQKAATLHRQADGVSQQINEVLDDYDQLITFLSRYYPAEQRLKSELASFNSLIDLNSLVNNGGQFYVTAADIRKQIDAIRAVPLPRGLEEVRDKTIATHTRAADGFDALAVALSPPVDIYIYSAAGELEAATAENDSNIALLQDNIEKLPAIKNTEELTEKIELFKY